MSPSPVRRIVCAGAAFLLISGPLAGQHASAQGAATPAGSAYGGQTQAFETRSQLEAQAQDAEAHHRTGEAWLLRTRLQRGDFQEGDRIFLALQGAVTFQDTLTVRAGKLLQLPKMGSLSLEGVLRSELADRVKEHVAKFLRDPAVRVTPLVRLSVLGQVNHPGYYYSSADLLLTDVLMFAGGPTGQADLGKVTIRRGPDVIWNAADVSTALSDGLSLDRLHLRAGDEITVGERSHFPWLAIVQIASVAAGVLVAVRSLR